MQEFREIPGTGGKYAASNDGQVMNTATGLLLKQHLSRDGYPRTNISVFPKSKQPVEIHRLVALAWHENPLNLPTVNHVDGVKTNNNAPNLEWASHRDNLVHAIGAGLRKCKKGIPTGRIGAANGKSKPVVEYGAAGERIASWGSCAVAARALMLPRSIVLAGCRNNTAVCGRLFGYESEVPRG